MRWVNRTTVRRYAVGGVVAMCLPGIWSCSENKETIVYETVYADTLYDTLRIPDTTVLRDTLYDTMYVAPGRAEMVLFGIVYDVSGLADSTRFSGTFDSVYAGVTCFANPARQDLRVLVNGNSMRREDAQREFLLGRIVPDLYYGVPFPAVNMGALLTATLWEDFIAAAPSYAFEVILPAYSTDTAASPAFDTVRQVLTGPRPVSGVRVSSNAGFYPRVYNARLRDSCHVVPGDSAITLTWDDSCDYYVVTVYKLKYFQGYGYDLVDTPYDTIVAISACRLPRGELSLGSTAGGYDIAEVQFVGINGPEPAAWDTLPSFERRGIALAFSYDNHYELLVPQGSRLLSKSLIVETPIVRRNDPLATVYRALGLSGPR